MKYIGKNMRLFPLFLYIMGMFSCFGEEENNPIWFDVNSETARVSAQCAIDGRKNEADDKKRKEVGIGEDITLTATGKALNDQKVTVEWELKTGGDIATLEEDPKNSKVAKLTIKKEVNNDGDVVVEAKAKKDEEEIASTTTTFNAKVPSGIKAKHSGLRFEGYPLCGDKINIGTSSKLVLILQPLSVSFANIEIREKAEDTEEEAKANWMGIHDVGDQSGAPDDRNEVRYDKIGVKGATVEEIQGWENFGKQAVWKCGWYVYGNNTYHHKISGKDYEQVFLITEDSRIPGMNLNDIKAFISKFGSTTERSTADMAFHVDKDTP